MTTIDCVCNTCTAIHTCRPTAATYRRDKHWVPTYHVYGNRTDAAYRVQHYRHDTAVAFYHRVRADKLIEVGRSYGALLRTHNATPATLDPTHLYTWAVDGYNVDRDEPQRSFFRNVLCNRVSYLFYTFLGVERSEPYVSALRNAEDKFNEGEYERPSMGPVFASGQAKARFRVLNFLHHLHWSKKFPGQVAYAESYDKLVADRWTTCKPGRYLMKYFADILNENEIRVTVEHMSAATLPSELHYVESNDPAGWVNVYANGPQSCMHGEDCVRVYAHEKSVLRLAYLSQNGNVVARCIVREDTKEWIRCYPNTDSEENQRWHTLMKNHVTNAGYTYGNLRGVLLKAVKLGRSYEDRYVCPYIDSGNGDYLHADLEYVDGCEYLRLGDYGGEATNTGGYVELNDGREECTDCNSMCDPDEMCYIESHGSICQCCARDNYTMAYGRRYEELIPNDEVVYCESDGCSYQRDYAHYHDVHECMVRNEWYNASDLCSTKGGYVHVDECASLGVDDDEGNSFAASGDVTETHDGRVIRKDESCVWFGKVCHKDDDPNELNESNEEGDE
jgi:hypothetical protein